MQEPSAALNNLSHAVLGAAIDVHRALGPGYAESVYEKALRIELGLRAHRVRSQVIVPIVYKGEPIGEHRLDALVDSPSGTESLLVEIKAVERFASIHTAQVVSYLRATGLPLGLLLNFNVPQMRMGVRRVILGEWFAGASNAACID